MLLFALINLLGAANVLAWPCAMWCLPWATRWLPQVGVHGDRARRGRRWGMRAYAAIMGLAGVQCGLLFWGREQAWAGLMAMGLTYTLTVGLASATIAGAVLGYFSGGIARKEP